MKDAPENIWTTGNKTTGSWNNTAISLRIAPEQTEYTRADIANARIAELEAALAEAFASCSHDLPEYHEQGMGCGLEDRNITDRYEAMGFGWEQAMERVESEIISHTQEILATALNPTTGAK
jgi:hypothetical protein